MLQDKFKLSQNSVKSHCNILLWTDKKMFITMTLHCNKDNKNKFWTSKCTAFTKGNASLSKKSDTLHNRCEKSKHKNHFSILLLQNKLQP